MYKKFKKKLKGGKELLKYKSGPTFLLNQKEKERKKGPNCRKATMDTRAPLNTLFPFPVPTQTHQSHHFPTDPSLFFFVGVTFIC